MLNTPITWMRLRELASYLGVHLNTLLNMLRAILRLKMKTQLKRYKYPPDQQITALDLVLQQAENLGEELVEAA